MSSKSRMDGVCRARRSRWDAGPESMPPARGRTPPRCGLASDYRDLSPTDQDALRVEHDFAANDKLKKSPGYYE